MRIPSPIVRRKARIEIIPLIDIVFFLLATFVMVSLSMVKNQGLNVNLPSAANRIVPPEKQVHATVTITQDGSVYLDKENVSKTELLSRLTHMRAADPDIAVYINGDEKTLFGDAIALLDDVRGLGITKVLIQTKPKKETAP